MKENKRIKIIDIIIMIVLIITFFTIVLMSASRQVNVNEQKKIDSINNYKIENHGIRN